MARGVVYLVVVMDWASRKALRWRLSPTLASDFCVAALEVEFLNVLRRRQIQISMDGKGCWRDNVFVERLWRSVKYEGVYLHGYETVSDVRAGLTRYFQFFNQRRPHRGLRSRIPDRVYFTTLPELQTPSPRAVPIIDAA
jgi:putative transposase